MISVVIPYFQREAGVLRRALASVAAQVGVTMPVEVLVVDDASPMPAEVELATMEWPAGFSARIIKRANGGPGAARNTGLDSVAVATEYIAFLDSDDEWMPKHLARAEAVMGHRHDFYFADHYHLGQQTSALVRGGRLNLNEHPTIGSPHNKLHAYQGDLFDQTLRGNVIGTSTVVYRWPRFKAERFKVEFTTAGEDYLFWMALARAGAKVAFSSEVEARYGRGVNVYSGSGWGTEGHLKRIHDEMAYKVSVAKQFSLNPVQRNFVKSELQRLRMAFVRDLLHRMRHGKHWPKGLLARHARLDLITFLSLPFTLLRIVMQRP